MLTAAQIDPRDSDIRLAVGRSTVLDFPDRIRRVVITDETIADALPITSRS